MHVRNKANGSVARLITLQGCRFYHEGDGFFHWESAGPRHSPAWLGCLTHADARVGVQPRDDELEAHLHLDEDAFDDAEMVGSDGYLCTTIELEFKRYHPPPNPHHGYVDPGVSVPMCVNDMPNVLDKLAWS